MKKDKKQNIEDFESSSLPKTRREQFKYLFINRFAKTILIGGLLALFALPSLAISIIKMYFLASIYSTYSDSLTSEMILEMRNTLLIFDSLQIIGIIVFAIGLAGAMKIIKQMCFDELLFVKKDFLQGIKENSKQFIVLSLLLSPIPLLYNFLMMTASLANNQTIKILVFVFLALYIFTIVPILTMMVSSISTYQNTFAGHFKNCVIIVLKHYFPYVFVSSILVLGIVILYILANVVSKGGLFIPVISLMLIYLLPLYLIINELYCFSKFDIYINKNYPTIYRKGLAPELNDKNGNQE